MTFTVVFFHAHPDDEALYTGGTMARLSSEGHRVVLVTATRGEGGLTSAYRSTDSLGAEREAELARAASALGVARVVVLGFGDSGMNGTRAGAFATVDQQLPVSRLTEILLDESADALVTYDKNGGYGHPDHVQVHNVGNQAAHAAKTRLKLYATVDRDLLRKAVTVAGWTRRAPRQFDAMRLDGCYTARSEITHRVDVRAHLREKRSAMEAHCTQTGGGESQRTLSWLLALPSPLFALVLGREWFVEPERPPGRRMLGDPLESLRQLSPLRPA